MKLFYRYWKPESETNSRVANKIVLLHGMGGTGALWRPVAAALEEDCEILAPDQRGHGESRIPAEGNSFTPLDYGRDVIECLQTLNFHPTWIVGHSMGVRTACATAHLRPDWVRGLILVDLGLSGEAGGGLGEDLARFLEVLPPSFPDRATAREFMARECPDPSIAQYLLAVANVASVASQGAGSKQLTFPFEKSALIETIRAAKNSPIREWVLKLASNGMPICLLRGERSLVWSREDFAAEQGLFEKFSNVRFEEIAGAGHGLPFEQRAVFVQRIRDFIISPDLR